MAACAAVISAPIAAATPPGRPGPLVVDSAPQRPNGDEGLLIVKSPGKPLVRHRFPIGVIAASPDGRHLAVSLHRRGLFIYRADGTGGRRVTRKDAYTSGIGLGHVSFSPDGRRLVFEGPGRRSRTGPPLYTIRIDGSGRHKLGVSGYWPAWSPDGKTIAFTRPGPEDTLTGGDLYFVGARGGGAHRVYRPSSPGEAVQALDWSPDGRRLVLQIENDAMGCEGAPSPCYQPPNDELVMTIIDRQGRLVKRLVYGQSPVWSPNGRQIAFGSPNESGRPDYEISEVDVSTGHVTRLFTTSSTFSIAWLPEVSRSG